MQQKYNKEAVRAYLEDDKDKLNKMVLEAEPIVILLLRIQEGNFYEDAYALAGIPESTFYEWKKNHPEFLEAIKKADIICKSLHIKNIKKHSDKQWQASAWYLERRYPNEFRERKEFEHKGKLTLEEFLSGDDFDRNETGADKE